MAPPKRCLYGKCQNTSKTNEDDSVYFVPFPKLVTARTRKRVENWVKACGRSGVSVHHVQAHHNRCFVCSTHFVGGDGPTKLNPDPITYVPDREQLKVKLFRNRKVCAVSDCESASSQEELVTFHPFPKHHLQLELWKSALNLDKDPPRYRAFVCSKHFISGRKSDFPSHPDFIPSIFASSPVAEIKALRLKLREFESGYAKLKLERNCASLRKHWYECGFSRTELIDGVRRVKSQKRKQAQEEKLAAEAKKRREMDAEAEREREESSIMGSGGNEKFKLKEEEISYAEADEEFIIENDRAEESGEDMGEDFDLSRVKEEPMSDSETPTVDTSCNSEKVSVAGGKDGTLNKFGESEHTILDHEIKSEPVDNEYDWAECPQRDVTTGDFCDEMLTVHFGSQGSSDDKPECDGNSDVDDNLTVSQNMNIQSDPYTQPIYVNQNLGFQNNETVPQSLHTGNVPSTQLLFSGQSQFQSVLPNTQPLYTNLNVGNQTGSLSQQQYANQTCGFQTILASQPLTLYTTQSLGIQSNINQSPGYQSNFINVFGPTCQFLGLPGSEQKMNTLQPASIPHYMTAAVPTPSLAHHTLTLAPHTATLAPHTVTLAPNTATLAPHTSTVATNTATLAPHTSTLAPNTSTLAPHTSTLAPHTSSLTAVSSTEASPSSAAVKTVFALDPSTYQSPVTQQMTFVVPKENVITLAIGGATGQKATLKGLGGSRSLLTNPPSLNQTGARSLLPGLPVPSPKDIPEKEQGKLLLDSSKDLQTANLDFKSRTSSLDSEQVSCDEESGESVNSIGYQPSTSASDNSNETSHPESCDIESIASETVSEKIGNYDRDNSAQDSYPSEMAPTSKHKHQMEDVKAPERPHSSVINVPTRKSSLQRTSSADTDSGESSISGKEVTDGVEQKSTDVQTEGLTSLPSSSSTDNAIDRREKTCLQTGNGGLEVRNSKSCQTKRSLSKEATLKRQLSYIGVEVTPDQLKYLLKQRLYASGMCPSIQRVRKWFSNCAIQVDMDKYVLPDLNSQCVHLSNEVSRYKQKLQTLTYDFLNCGSSKTNVLCHTGCYTVNTLKELFEYVSICLESPPLDDLSQFQEFVLTLMKIRLGLHNHDLAFRFEVEPSVVPDILTKWITIFKNTLSFLIDWPDHEPERTEHRNQRWRLLKLRYDLLRAYDGIESLKDKWLLDQDLDDMIKICDVLNSFQVEEKTPETPVDPNRIYPEPVGYFIEEIVVEENFDDDCHMSSGGGPKNQTVDHVTDASPDNKESKEDNAEKDRTATDHVTNSEGTKDTHGHNELKHSNFTEDHDSEMSKDSEKKMDKESKCPETDNLNKENDGLVEGSARGQNPEESIVDPLDRDLADSTKRQRQQRVSNIYYVDDSDGVLIGAPELEVEIWESEVKSLQTNKRLEWGVCDFVPSMEEDCP